MTEGDQRALWNHDSNHVLGRRRAETLELAEDDTGLRFVIYPPDTQVGRDALESMRRGDVDQMSFAFRALDQVWDTPSAGQDVRRIKDVQLFDVSIVNRGAYPETSIALRSRDDAKAEARKEKDEATAKAKADSYFKRKAETENRLRRI